MRITFSIDEHVVERARARLRAQRKSLNQAIRERLRCLAGDDQLKSDLQFLRSTAGRGNSKGLKFDGNEIYERK